MYLIIAHFAGSHSGEVYLDLSVANLALLVMNFVLVPRCRFVEIDKTWVVGSLSQNFQVSMFIICCYFLIKKIHIMYVRSEIEREDNDRILNTLNEGVLILRKDANGEASNIIFMNQGFRRFTQSSEEEEIEFSSLQEKNLLLHSKDLLPESLNSKSLLEE